MMSVNDFARFVAAAVPGPNGEPAGRGVLRPETVALAMTPQPATNGTCGLGYGIDRLQNGRNYVLHLGGDPGWRAAFALHPESRSGLVVATNSDRADNMLLEVMDIWSRSTLGSPLPVAPNRVLVVADPYRPLRYLILVVSVLLGLGLVGAAARVWAQARSGMRRRAVSHSRRAVLITIAYVLPAAGWLLWFHTTVPMPFPASWLVPIWPAEFHYLTTAVLAGVCLGIVTAWLPRQKGRPGNLPALSHAQVSVSVLNDGRRSPKWRTPLHSQ